MATLLEMCQFIADKSNGEWTADSLLKYSEGSNSMQSSLRIGEIVATYGALLHPVEYTRMPLNFKRSRGEPFVVTE